jgi:hypothetical protein
MCDYLSKFDCTHAFAFTCVHMYVFVCVCVCVCVVAHVHVFTIRLSDKVSKQLSLPAGRLYVHHGVHICECRLPRCPRHRVTVGLYRLRLPLHDGFCKGLAGVAGYAGKYAESM